MKPTTGFEIAHIIQQEFKVHFSRSQVTNITIDGDIVTIDLTDKLTGQPAKFTIQAERQDNNAHNYHYSLFECDPLFTTAYAKNRSQYVRSNHELANTIENARLVPDNLYLIQSATGQPGIDFIDTQLSVDAINLLLLISRLFRQALT